MAVEMHLVPQFRVRMPPMIRHGKTHVSFRRPSIAFGELCHFSSSKWKLLEVHCDDSPKDGADDGLLRRHFDGFIAHEAVYDEQYWAAACLRAEAHWESLSYMRHVNTYKRKYAEQEFYALKRRCSGQDGNSLKCFCVIALAVKREEGSNGTALDSVVGTLDVSIRQLFHRETYPGEIYRPKTILARHEPLGAHRYAYIANVCVSTCARRQGVATNMIYLANDLATFAGIKKLYVHVNADNEGAQNLYLKAGFKVVRAVSAPLTGEARLLMSMEL